MDGNHCSSGIAWQSRNTGGVNRVQVFNEFVLQIYCPVKLLSFYTSLLWHSLIDPYIL